MNSAKKEIAVIPVVSRDEKQKKFFVEKRAKDVFIREITQRKPVRIVSVAGQARKGKSFLLNFLKEELYGNDGSTFVFNSGIRRQTTGLHILQTPVEKKKAGLNVKLL